MFLIVGRQTVLRLTAQQPIDAAIASELRAIIDEALIRLAPRERWIIVARFFENKTLRECAKLLQLRSERVRLFEARALRKLGLTVSVNSFFD